MIKMKRLLKRTAAPRKGFTLIEMVIVLAIIALLMLIIVPNLNNQRESAGKRQKEALTQVVENQAEMYANDNDIKNSDWKEQITFEKLEHDGYLNKKQIEKAKKQDIKIPEKAVVGSKRA
ncbi:competence type IV pilus major pilin ComGC [Lactiplantibacillus daowaiensis]|uniref:Competence type IV pilus major pilin ComGC n=1 Tax=Lactiplantibacillus daowaiensis TaxID=2559918 RepID=A0ABW1S0Z8_9LACO|nr:competence type IV pilus major pilin ComGC [Lactiplantibacillus daowaiensis]